MSDEFGAPSNKNAAEAELQDFLMMEKQKAQVNAQVLHNLNATQCWYEEIQILIGLFMFV